MNGVHAITRELLLPHCTADRARSSPRCSGSAANRPGRREVLENSAVEENALFWAQDVLGWVVRQCENTTTFTQQPFYSHPCD